MNGDQAERARTQERLDRIHKVGQLRLAGIRDQRAIAKQLGVDRSTISRDFKAIDELWKERAAEDIGKAKGQDLERLDELIAALWSMAKQGQWLATDRVLALLQHRARILGLEAAQKREHTGPDGGPIELVDARHRLAAKVDHLADRVRQPVEAPRLLGER